jgi:DNA-binding Lrp family transcriptional regulator
MTLKGLDDLDRYIIYALQRDARHTSSNDIATEMDVSPSTVRKRVQRLEETGIITGYHAEVDFEAAGYQLLVQVVCTAPITERAELADRAMDVSGVVAVRELAVGEENLLVSVVATDNDDLTRIATALSELGLRVSEEQLIRGERVGPYRKFGTETTEE